MYLGIFLIGAVLTLKGYMTVGAIVAASQLMVHITSPLTMISSDISELQTSLKVVQHIGGYLTDRARQHRTEKQGAVSCPDIRACELSFEYDRQPVFRQVNAFFEKGKKYLIMGPSGSGKSTLLTLLAGRCTPHAGYIEIDGERIYPSNSDILCRYVLMNPQEPYFFDWSIRDNICLFKPVSDEKIFQLLEQVGLKKKIDSLPNGLDSRFGENGISFSGGEKQRIGIVRALLRDQPILLMDECTAHLDSISAQKVESLLLTQKDRTVIMVSHRLSGILQQLVDDVFVLSNKTFRSVKK